MADPYDCDLKTISFLTRVGRVSSVDFSIFHKRTYCFGDHLHFEIMAAKVIKLCFFDDSDEDDDSEEEEEEEQEAKDDCGGQNDGGKVGSESGSGNGSGSKAKEKLSHLNGKRRHASSETGATKLSKRCGDFPLPSSLDSAPPIEKKARLPLPAAFAPSSSFSSSSSSSDSLSVSTDGRIRSFAHVRGNWASHVFLRPFDDDESMTVLAEKIVARANEILREESTAAIKVHILPPEDLHLSLSRTFVLGHHLISSFTSSLSSSLRQAALDSIVGDKSSLLVTFTSNVKVYFNDEGTRGFIAIQVHPSCQQRLELLTSAVDETLKEFNLGDQVFYSDPSFHLSLAWFLPPEVATREGEAKEEGVPRDARTGNCSSAVASQSSFSSSLLSSSETNSIIDPSSASHCRSSSSLPLKVISTLEKSLSSLVADHFRDDDDDDTAIDNSRAASGDASAAESAATMSTFVTRAMLKTGNKLHSFSLTYP